MSNKLQLDHQELESLAQKSQTQCEVDFNMLCGCTLKERFASLYMKLTELSAVMIRKGASGYFWIVTSPEIASLIKNATASFNPCRLPEAQRPMGVKDYLDYLGILDRSWSVWSDPEWPTNTMLLGTNPYVKTDGCYVEAELKTNEIPENYQTALLTLNNFCI
jgi:hypothetical protein